MSTNGTETGWVLEHETSEPCAPRYLSTCPLKGYVWSPDHLKALRFARREDAEAVAANVYPASRHRVAEHAWS
jgi:hypothetical protein